MMRGTYGTVEDEDEDDVERQRHLSSERNFVPRDAFSSSQRRGSNTSGNRNTIATRVAMLSVAAVASLAVVQKTSERTLLVNDDGASAASASSSVVFGAAEEDFQLGRNFGIYTFENFTRFTTTRGW